MSCDADHGFCFGLLIATLVEFVLANEGSHDRIECLVWPFLLAVFGECQLVAENLHAAEWVSRARIKAVRLTCARNKSSAAERGSRRGLT